MTSCRLKLSSSIFPLRGIPDTRSGEDQTVGNIQSSFVLPHASTKNEEARMLADQDLPPSGDRHPHPAFNLLGERTTMEGRDS